MKGRSGNVHVQYRDVRRGVGADDPGTDPSAVLEADGHLAAAGDDMLVGEDVALGVEDDSGAFVLRGLGRRGDLEVVAEAGEPGDGREPGEPGDGREARDIRNAGEAEPGHANLRGGDDVDHARAVLPVDLVHGQPMRGGDEGTRDPLAADAFDHCFRPVGCAACGYHERGQSADDRACEHSERLSTALAHIRFDGLHLVVGDRAPRGRDQSRSIRVTRSRQLSLRYGHR